MTTNAQPETQSVQRLVVVGGVAGGMSSAARARRLSDSTEIIVLEQGAEVSFANCGLPYFVGGEIQEESALRVQTTASLKASLNLDVRTHSKVIALDAAKREITVDGPDGQNTLTYDALVLSPGGVAATPPITGLNDSHRVKTLRTVPDAVEMRDIVDSGAKRAVVLGAGFIGLEAAEALAMRGLDTTIVELAPHVLPPLEDELATLATNALRDLNITVRAGVGAQAIESGADHDVVVLSDGTRLDADLIVLSVGVRPDTAVFEQAGIATERGSIVIDEHGRTNLEGVYAVGDATVSTHAITGARRPVALAGPVNRAGRLVSDFIFNPSTARELPKPKATAIVRIGEYGVAMTGANTSELKAAGIEFETVHLHPLNHAGYFPGAQTIALIVHFAPVTGQILGAQAVAKEGADKRIDVIATAIRGGLTITDLIDIDLSYSPPFGSAKDPVNLAGMMGENVLTGTTKLWYPGELTAVLDDALLLDVRGAGEFAQRHVRGAVNIPHIQVRERLDEIRELAGDRPVRVMCHSGMRSYIAHRILDQAGFDSKTLSGGIVTLSSWLGDDASDVLEIA